MEVEKTFNYSDIFTENTTSVEETGNGQESWIQVIFRPILIIAGTVGNGLTIYIMRRTSLNHLSSCFYMVILAVADSSE